LEIKVGAIFSAPVQEVFRRPRGKTTKKCQGLLGAVIAYAWRTFVDDVDVGIAEVFARDTHFITKYPRMAVDTSEAPAVRWERGHAETGKIRFCID